MNRKLVLSVFVSILLLSLCAAVGFAAEIDRPQVGISQNRPMIALALGGGGIRGAAHIGVLRVLEREHIPIDYVAGCSMGSILGGMYCAGVPVDRIQMLMEDNELQHAYAHGHVPVEVLRYGIRRLGNVFHKKNPMQDYLPGRSFENFLDKCISPSKQRIEDLEIPFCAVATNLVDGQEGRLTTGNLGKAILASSAVPPLIQPVEISGNLYVDGSFLDNVAVCAARQFHPDLIIAVPIDGGVKLKRIEKRQFTGIRAIAWRVEDILMDVTDNFHLKDADIVIRPDVDNVTMFSRKASDVTAAVAAGEVAAIKALPEIRQAINQWNKAQLARLNNQMEVSQAN